MSVWVLTQACLKFSGLDHLPIRNCSLSVCYFSPMRLLNFVPYVVTRYLWLAMTSGVAMNSALLNWFAPEDILYIETICALVLWPCLKQIWQLTFALKICHPCQLAPAILLFITQVQILSLIAIMIIITKTRTVSSTLLITTSIITSIV